ncbi:hypothetical protein KYG_15715 [Acidovorax sp. NO-1]|uniref:DUF72 domain-containing protein n=1 Tax=Acidovorax sp. NO-1 TaxID=512030 RepID=UPI00023FD2DC|nr:DUF72 domain-containing protein [Acidovorax sp. NO-1]EHL21885.1 hypothetical protein KYG_15715 [Acidovorax sp. NO-1]
MPAPAADPAAHLRLAFAHAGAPLFVGTAGWSLPRASPHPFTARADSPAEPHLARYARQLTAVEINSSFYRPHQRATYQRWAAATPAGFRFCVKLPRSITHDARLQDANALLQTFVDQASGLGDRLGCLLVQLPPSLVLDAPVANIFFASLRRLLPGGVGLAVEPRHASWFTPEADALLAHWQAARVLADPVLHDAGRAPGGWPALVYCRLHGSPRTYYSAYDAGLIDALATRLKAATQESPLEAASVWCIFDNTASGAATENALDLQAQLRSL